MKLRWIIFLGTAFLIMAPLQVHMARILPSNARSARARNSSPLLSQTSTEESDESTAWEASKKANLEPRSYSKRLDGVSDRRRIAPVDLDVVVANNNPSLPKSVKNIRGGRRQKETIVVPVVNNGAFSESRRPRVLPNRQRPDVHLEVEKTSDQPNRGNRQASIRQRPDYVSLRRGRPNPVQIDESKIEVYNLDMESGRIESTSKNIKNREGTDKTTVEQSRSRSRFKIENDGEVTSTVSNLITRTRSRNTEALYERSESEPKESTTISSRATFKPRPATTTLPSTSYTVRSRTNFRRATVTTLAPVVFNANRRSSSLDEDEKVKQNSSRRIPSLPTSRLLRKKLDSTTEKPSETTSIKSIKTRGSFKAQTKASKGDAENGDDYESENYPEHFKSLLRANDKTTTPVKVSSTQEALTSRGSQRVVKVYNSQTSTGTANLVQQPFNKYAKLRSNKYTTTTTESLNEDTKIDNEVISEDKNEFTPEPTASTYVDRRSRYTRTTVEPESKTEASTSRHAKYEYKNKFNATRYNFRKNKIEEESTTEIPVKINRAFTGRPNFYSRSKSSTTDTTPLSFKIDLNQSTMPTTQENNERSGNENPKLRTRNYLLRYKPPTAPTRKAVTIKSIRLKNVGGTYNPATIQKKSDIIKENFLTNESEKDSEVVSAKDSTVARNKASLTIIGPTPIAPGSRKGNRFSSRYRGPFQRAPPAYQATVPTITSTMDIGEENKIYPGFEVISFSQPRSTPASDSLITAETVMMYSRLLNVETSNHSPSVTVSIFDALADILTSTPKPVVSTPPSNDIKNLDQQKSTIDNIIGVSTTEKYSSSKSEVSDGDEKSSDVTLNVQTESSTQVTTTTKLVQYITENNVGNTTLSLQSTDFSHTTSDTIALSTDLTTESSSIKYHTEPTTETPNTSPISSTKLSERKPFATIVLYSTTTPYDSEVTESTSSPLSTEVTDVIDDSVVTSDQNESSSTLESTTNSFTVSNIELTSPTSTIFDSLLETTTQHQNKSLTSANADALSRLNAFLSPFLNNSGFSRKAKLLRDIEQIILNNNINTLEKITLSGSVAVDQNIMENLKEPEIDDLDSNIDEKEQLDSPIEITTIMETDTSSLSSLVSETTTIDNNPLNLSSIESSIETTTNPIMKMETSSLSNVVSETSTIDNNLLNLSSVETSIEGTTNSIMKMETSSLSNLISETSTVNNLPNSSSIEISAEATTDPIMKFQTSSLSNVVSETTTTENNLLNSSSIETSIEATTDPIMKLQTSSLPNVISETTTIENNIPNSYSIETSIEATTNPILKTETSSVSNVVSETITIDLAIETSMKAKSNLNMEMDTSSLSNMFITTTAKSNIELATDLIRSKFNYEDDVNELNDDFKELLNSSTLVAETTSPFDDVQETTIDEMLTSTFQAPEVTTSNILSTLSLPQTIEPTTPTILLNITPTTPTYQWTPPFPTAWRDRIVNEISQAKSELQAKRPPKKDYYIYGVLPNNTVVRKNPNDNQLEVLTEASPYIIFGVLSNNTIIRKFPNGTNVPSVMQRIDVLPIDPRSLKNPNSPVYKYPDSIKPLNNQVDIVSTNEITQNQETDINVQPMADPVNKLNDTIEKNANKVSTEISIKDIEQNAIVESEANKPSLSTESNVFNLKTTSKLPDIQNLLQTSIAAAIREETLRSSSTTTSTTPQYLTLDIDPETKMIRTEKPADGNNSAVFRFKPISNEIVSTEVTKIKDSVIQRITTAKTERPTTTTTKKYDDSTLTVMLRGGFIDSTTYSSTRPEHNTEVIKIVTPTPYKKETQVVNITQRKPISTTMTTTTTTTSTTTTTERPTTRKIETTTIHIPVTTEEITVRPSSSVRSTSVRMTSPRITSPRTTTTTESEVLDVKETIPTTIRQRTTTTTSTQRSTPTTTRRRTTTTTEAYATQVVTTSKPVSPSTFSVDDDIAFLNSLRKLVTPAPNNKEQALANRIVALAEKNKKDGSSRGGKNIKSSSEINDILSALTKPKASDSSNNDATSIKPEISTFSVEEDIKFLNNLQKLAAPNPNDKEQDLANRIIALAVERNLVGLKGSTTETPTTKHRVTKPTIPNINQNIIKQESNTHSVEDDIQFLTSLRKLINTDSQTKEQSLTNQIIAQAVDKNLAELKSNQTTTTTQKTRTSTRGGKNINTKTNNLNSLFSDSQIKEQSSPPNVQDQILTIQNNAKLLQTLIDADLKPSTSSKPATTTLKDSDLKLLQNILANPSPLNDIDSNSKTVKTNSVRTTTERKISTTTESTQSIEEDIKSFQQDAKLLQTLLKLQGKGQTTPKTKINLTGLTGDRALAALLAEPDKPVTVSPTKVSTEYGQSNDAILAALLKEKGIGPTTSHNSLEEQLKLAALLEQVIVTPKQRPRTTTRRPPPPPARPQRPILDGLAWLWQQWQQTGAGPEGNRPSQSSTSQGGGFLFGSGPFIGNADEVRDTRQSSPGNRVPLPPPQIVDTQEGPGRGQLVTAAINVTRAFSQFLGAAIQGAAQTFQNVFRTGTRAAGDYYGAGSG